MAKKIWKDEYVYKRLLEILDAYWLEEADEAAVNIMLHFRHKDGQTQDKYLTWRNPNMQGGVNWDISHHVRTARQLQEMSIDDKLLEEIKTFYEIGKEEQ